jgi:hypothetical protein
MYKPKPKWWLTETTPAACVVAAFGGPSRTAEALGCAPSCVSRWQTDGRVPQRWHKKILAKTKKVSAWVLVYGRAGK